MEGKVAKIGLVIMIAMVALRFIVTENQKNDLSALFSRNNQKVIIERTLNEIITPHILMAGDLFQVDYTRIEKRRVNLAPVQESRMNEEIAMISEEESLPLDYSSSNGFEMFVHLNSEEVRFSVEENTEPLEAQSTINATMDRFFPRR